MSSLSKDQSLIECPRCLGKGHVDLDDIKRLDMELKWLPGPCAYCDGNGKVDKSVADNVPVDATYLANNVSGDEREKLISGDPDALARANQFEDQTEDLINQIWKLHFEYEFTPLQIAEFLLPDQEPSDSYESQKQKIADYVEKVIQKKASEN